LVDRQAQERMTGPFNYGDDRRRQRLGGSVIDAVVVYWGASARLIVFGAGARRCVPSAGVLGHRLRSQ
jgi:hypothetical protein